MWKEFLKAIGIKIVEQEGKWFIAYSNKWWQWLLWALIGNDDAGQEHYSNSSGKYYSFVKWWLRNPAHNLTKYVLGFGKGELQYSMGKRYPSFPDEVRVDYLKCNFHPISVLPKGIWYPFIHGPHFYWGWRADGTFGVKVKL